MGWEYLSEITAFKAFDIAQLQDTENILLVFISLFSVCSTEHDLTHDLESVNR